MRDLSDLGNTGGTGGTAGTAPEPEPEMRRATSLTVVAYTKSLKLGFWTAGAPNLVYYEALGLRLPQPS